MRALAALAALGFALTPPDFAPALHPLPQPMRAAAGVIELDPQGRPHVLRASSNGMICFLAPVSDTLYDARCYQQQFIVVVERQFQLSDLHVPFDSLRGRIEAEIHAGRIVLPVQPTAGYRCLGPRRAYDAASDSTGAAIRCWQSIHFPFRTAREIGLIEESQLPDTLHDADQPFVMASGTYWAHVMIVHP
jgi:hypothetical protein